MVSAGTWERIERQKLRGRDRRTRHHRPGEWPDPSRPVGTDLLPQVKHIVVLMMENHSFDSYLGSLGRGEGFPVGDDGLPDAENPDSAGNISLFRRYMHYRRRRVRHHLASLGRPLVKTSDVFKRDLQFTAAIYPLGMAGYMAHVRSLEQFFADADSGNLPSFCIVDPDFRTFSEETPQDIRKGESFAAEVINRVMHGKAWADTLLIWTYDEHGGYYDHVAPPAAVPPDDIPGRSRVAHSSPLRSLLKILFPGYVRHAEELVAGPDAYDTYGVRVPAVIVSPYARRDFVLSDVLDHTSVLKLIEEKWNLPALTRRDAAAISPLGALDLSAPPAFLTPPQLPAPALAWGTW